MTGCRCRTDLCITDVDGLGRENLFFTRGNRVIDVTINDFPPIKDIDHERRQIHERQGRDCFTQV